jgi:polysaccharide export outer membrane protein
VIVYQHPEFSSSSLETRMRDKGLLVNSKGDIRLPLVKSIHIAGLTQTEALDKVENAFKKYLKSPDIYLEVLNKRAYVIGEVKTPGEIELVNEKISLIQILAKAGDLTDFANKKSIMILRSKQGQVNSQIVDLTDINSLRTSNLMIKPNDIVYVLPNDMKPFNRGIKDIDPIFGLIGHILSPFVSMKYLSN